MSKSKKQKGRFYFHLTDTFGGETNYCWIKRYFVDANSLHGALCIISRETGYNFSLYCNEIYHAKGACIALVLDDVSSMWIENIMRYKSLRGK